MLSTEIVVVMSKTAHDDCALALMFTRYVMRIVRRLQLVAASSPVLSSMQLMSLSVMSRANVVGVALVDVERVPATSSVQRLAILLGGRAEIAPGTVAMFFDPKANHLIASGRYNPNGRWAPSRSADYRAVIAIMDAAVEPFALLNDGAWDDAIFMSTSSEVEA